MRKTAALVSGILFSVSMPILATQLPTPIVKGKLTQGGMAIGQLENVSKLTFNGKEIKQNPDGYFVIGFGRDAQSEHQLSWVNSQGKVQEQVITITTREYKTESIEGVEQKYVSPPESVLQRIRSDAAKVRKARATFSEQDSFLAPVYRPASGRISGVYGSQRIFNGTPKRPHYGLDIANKTGTPIYAPMPGTVVLADNDQYYSGGTLIIDHGYGLSSTYIHMHQLDVEVGQQVHTGDVIGQIGATGRVTGPHLDWRFNWFEHRLDPQLFMIDKLASEMK